MELKWLDKLPTERGQPIYTGLDIHGRDGKHILSSDYRFFLICEQSGGESRLIVMPATEAGFEACNIAKDA